MDVIIQWVTQIILFVILAAIIDLLIPVDAMKKYVKLAVGLILILILLKPVFYLFDADIEQAVETSIDQLDQAYTQDENIENQIEFQKKEIQNSQHAYILEQMTVQLKNIAEDPLKEEFQVEITSIDFTFEEVENLSFEDLVEVIVYIKELENEEGAVDTVEEIVIDSQHNDQDSEGEKEEVGTEIATLLMDEWELTDKKVSIYWEGGTS
ncbi:stage III sporulation protein AF [Oceanobacillus profundus]|uniref:Stage III sporulation protein AF n=1 Tax=Oceanobacillus profundus TaxID=372463 RepID=A0A417YG75_9BACI|nr:stage III sporulation protein AF [Oceanobacillus profundus]MBR3118924.1 stage III sporulation protein AF [Oceanobacillus sp.]PAE31180.1 stage III sporulation protein AF [Paenibacillus sp. 7884-2]MCM3396730.1 stage III sporulation protein AF [Oceanobacillus profundus]MDO6448030.1 stage III sporulation protein AF [Oceanobacillus profundus]RHW31687.1 stage III sporulation protein AF [Oceanobacillus profundus]